MALEGVKFEEASGVNATAGVGKRHLDEQNNKSEFINSVFTHPNVAAGATVT